MFKDKVAASTQYLTFAHNCTIHESAGYALFLLMRRILWLPIDLVFGTVLDNPDVVTYDNYIQALQKDTMEAMLIAQTLDMDQLKSFSMC